MSFNIYFFLEKYKDRIPNFTENCQFISKVLKRHRISLPKCTFFLAHEGANVAHFVKGSHSDCSLTPLKDKISHTQTNNRFNLLSLLCNVNVNYFLQYIPQLVVTRLLVTSHLDIGNYWTFAIFDVPIISVFHSFQIITDFTDFK